MRASASSSCWPQSQRSEWKTSPVRHSECTRTSTSFCPSISPLTMATWCLSSTSERKPTTRKSPNLVGSCPRDALDQLVVAAPVRDQVGDRDHLELVLRAVALEVGHARHRAVVVHHLADHAGRVEPGSRARSTAASGLPGALEHAAGLRLQREDVARLDEVLRPRAPRSIATWIVWARSCAEIRVGDALARLDRDRERRLEGRLVLGRHQVEAELVAALGWERQADQPRPCVAMKLIASGVANCAASVRSPSFSRSSASQTRPCSRRGCPRWPPRSAERGLRHVGASPRTWPAHRPPG